MLELQDVHFQYGRTPALAGVSMRIDSGERVAVVGPNGSGKSTLLRVAGGSLAPCRGQVLLNGRGVRSMAPRERARALTWVPQNVFMSLPFTVREVVLMGRSPHQGWLGLERSEDTPVVAEALQAMGLVDLASRPFDTLSGGEAQRTILAAALSQQPQWMLLDEPTAHLDIRHQLDVLDVLSRSNTTLVMSLHDLNLAALFASRLVLLRSGAVVADGPPAEVLTPEVLARAYDIKVLVDTHPTHGVPQVHLLRP